MWPRHQPLHGSWERGAMASVSACGAYDEGVCPMNTVSFASIRTSLPMKCAPSNIRDECPVDYVCTTQGTSSYCCSPQESKCPSGTQPYLNKFTRTPQRCTVGVSQCGMGFTCQSMQKGVIIGFCCTNLRKTSNQRMLSSSHANPREENSIVNVNDALSPHNDGVNTMVTSKSKKPEKRLLTLQKQATCPPGFGAVYYESTQLNVECTPAEGLKIRCPDSSNCIKAHMDLAGRSTVSVPWCCKTTIVNGQSLFVPLATSANSTSLSGNTCAAQSDLFYLVCPNRYAGQLYEDLLYYYNKNVRPVKNASESTKVKFGSSLIRLIDVDEVNQVLTTNLWLEMQWFDYRLLWDPAKYGAIRKLHIPVDQIWIPDILLYNNADGEPHITIMSDALVYHNGLVVWKPPSIYKSFCSINIEYFPYDTQKCKMKFGGWTYHGYLLDMRQLPTTGMTPENKKDEYGEDYQYLEKGMDLSTYYPSLEWDLMALSSSRHEKLYPGCCGQDFYIDVTFQIELRRKTLFYTINLVIPCMMFAILTSFVFYVPPIEHKMTFSISILVTLTVFYLVLIDLVPPTSLVIPLIGKYLLFTMFLVSISIILSVVSLNFYRRDGTSFPMPHWMRYLFIYTLPRYICIKPVDDDDVSERGSSISDIGAFMDSRRPSPFFITVPTASPTGRLTQISQHGLHPDLIRAMIDNVVFIAEHFRALKKEDKISEDWSYVANVIDRIFLIIFTVANLAGTWMIVYSSPVLFDNRAPMSIGEVARPLSGDTFEHYINENFTQLSWWNSETLY
ncbi:unnamed protein product [Caenorhabditis auriculariae]|uniref:Uncharacterized protein n=1 Tax=Caenorhabditis auriculariae TaxID=2777116 RepID=A0A8S1H093_9PELO|nr:unnamed protein product [Caenorhabditis auriculariae]